MFRTLMRSVVVASLAGAAAPVGTAQLQPPQTRPEQPMPPPSTPPAPIGTGGTIAPTPPPTPGAIGTLPAPQAPLPPCAPADMSASVALLDRMQRILDDATKDSMGKVSMDRGGVDELRAEIAQVRAAIAPVKPQ